MRPVLQDFPRWWVVRLGELLIRHLWPNFPKKQDFF
jgi:hypothetical protein